MSQWKSGIELTEKYDLKGIELFNHVSTGLQPYSQSGKRIPPPPIQEKLAKLRLLKKHRDDLAEEINHISPLPIVQNRRSKEMEKWKSRYRRLKNEVELLEAELSRQNIYSWQNFDLPGSEDDYSKIFDLLKNALYKTCDTEKKLSLSDRKTNDKKDRHGEKLQCAEPNRKRSSNLKTVSVLTFCAESDEEISIKEYGKPKKRFKYNHADFQYIDCSTKEWSCLVKILKEFPHLIELGQSKDKNKYERRRKRRDRLNTKLIIIIKNNFSNVTISDDGKLFEKYDDEEKRPGRFKFKFNIDTAYNESDDFDKYRKTCQRKDKRSLLSLLTKQYEEHATAPNTDHLRKKNKIIVHVLIEKYGLSEDEIADIITKKPINDQVSDEFKYFDDQFEQDICD